MHLLQIENELEETDDERNYRRTNQEDYREREESN
jgi:hypothetical protein